MELKDFVSETIKQIIDGVNSAREYAQKNNASINPAGYHTFGDTKNFAVHSVTGEYSQIVEFDVAVTTSEGGELKSGIGIFIAALGGGAQAKYDQASSTANRIRFSIPIRLPKD